MLTHNNSITIHHSKNVLYKQTEGSTNASLAFSYGSVCQAERQKALQNLGRYYENIDEWDCFVVVVNIAVYFVSDRSWCVGCLQQHTMSQSESYSSEQSYGWINWFCNLEDHQFFCRVDEEYIRDSFNLYGLKQMFDHYNEALEMILRPEAPEDDELQDQRYLSIYQQATDIYGLIHARYIVTPKGLAIMREKFIKGAFGVCPRVLCDRQPTLPIGMSEQIRTSRVKIYCPKCQEVYMPKKKCHDIDGAYFGCSFPNILLMVYPDMVPKTVESVYVPKVYGFKVFGLKGSKYEKKENKKEITYYTQEQLKKIKSRNDPKDKKEKERSH